MKYDIVTIGDAFEDVFVEPDLDAKYDRGFASGRGICFELGEKIPLEAVTYEIGGSACNTAVGLSRLGFKASIVTTLGDDTPRDKVIERLRDEDVDATNIYINEKLKSGFSVVFSIKGERTIFVYHGLKDYRDLKIKKGIKSRWFFLTPIGEHTEEIEKRVVKEVAENGAHFAWNPGSVQISRGASHYKHLLNCTDILFLNREEAIKFLNFPVRPQTEEVMKNLHLLGAKIVVVTNGKEGAKAYDGKNFYNAIPNLRTIRADATGAGDSFATGVLGRLIEVDWKNLTEDNIKEALKWGIKNSDSVIQYMGAQKGLLNKEEISS